MKTTILGILFFFLFYLSHSQRWEKVYGKPNTSESFRDLAKGYDNGLVVSSSFENPQANWIFKTDVNGNILWDKFLLWDNTSVYPGYIKQAKNGDLIIASNINSNENGYWPLMVKLNSCGEKLWCRVFHVPNDIDYGLDILKINEGMLIALIRYYGTDIQNERNWLFKMNEDGEIIWKKVYGQSDPKVFAEDIYMINISNDDMLFLTGSGYYPNPGQTTPGWLRPYWIKVDSAGNELWDLAYGIDDYFYGDSYAAAIDNNGNVYASGRHIEIEGKNEMDHPAIFKYSSNGEPLYYKDIVMESEYGKATTIDFLNDTTLVLGAGWCMDLDSCHDNCYLTDTLGNIIKQRTLIIDDATIRGADVTHDGKIVMTGGFYLPNQHNTDIYLWKMNSDLEDDSLYTAHFTYDSLCPYQIISDTLDCNCTIVDVKEILLELESDMEPWIYPNPAKDVFTIVLPEETFLINKNIPLNSLLSIEVFNNLGQKIMEINPDAQDEEVKINSGNWNNGLYLVRISALDQILKEEKLIIQ
jgi:Secretion system C-terminal sorting domain